VETGAAPEHHARGCAATEVLLLMPPDTGRHAEGGVRRWPVLPHPEHRLAAASSTGLAEVGFRPAEQCQPETDTWAPVDAEC
jgi:hypothetical protein